MCRCVSADCVRTMNPVLSGKETRRASVEKILWMTTTHKENTSVITCEGEVNGLCILGFKVRNLNFYLRVLTSKLDER